jgi:hypothetical protein
MAQSAPAGFGPSFLPGGTQAQVDPNALRDSKFGRPDFVPSNIPPKGGQIINQPPQPPGFSIFDNAQTGGTNVIAPPGPAVGIDQLGGFGQFGGGPTGPATGPFGPSAPDLAFDQTQQFGRQPAGGFGGALSSVLGSLFGGFGGLDKNGPNAGPNNTPIESNPFNAGTNNPFLTGALAPSTFDPFTNQGLLTGNGPGRGITTDRQNNLVGVPPPPASPFRGGVGTRQAGRGLLNRGGRRGRFQTR